jgi:hypothetical protein
LLLLAFYSQNCILVPEMDILSTAAFIPGDPSQKAQPLGRYLPDIPEGIVTTYLKDSGIGQGSVVLDPFGTSVHMLLEIARAGYRVLTAINNPITRFVLEVEADPPTRAELLSALAELASSRKGDEKLESHLSSLYLTKCPQCQSSIPAEEFVWDKSATVPSKRIIQCKYCGNSGEYAVLPEDQELINRLASTAAMHKYRALERVVAPGDPDRVYAEEALEYHLPRSLYSLITIINRMDGLQITERQRRDLMAMILGVFDEANTLWPLPYDRPRPRQLIIPKEFREINVWLALERSIDIWSQESVSVEITTWPDLPGDEGGISIFEGSQRDFSNQLKDLPIDAVVTVIPRLNQAFWSLSALWAGFLWGHEAVKPFKHVLRRQRYDWSWHASALLSVFKSMSSLLSLNVPFLTLLAEPEPSFLTAVFKAALASGFSLKAIAMRSQHDPIQIQWQRQAFDPLIPEPVDNILLRGLLASYMEKRGEPITYLHVHTASLAILADLHSLDWQAELVADIQSPIQEVLKEPIFTRFGGSSHSLETGYWGVSSYSMDSEPLPDQVEKFTVHYLTDNPDVPRDVIEAAVNNEFPGLYTPQLAIIQNILESYGSRQGNDWLLRKEDHYNSRLSDTESMQTMLLELGNKLNYQVSILDSELKPILWKDQNNLIYSYYVTASAVIGRIFKQIPNTEGILCLVIPGGRAGLVSYKIERDPVLKEISLSWQLLKYRQVRSMSLLTNLTREDWRFQLGADPVTNSEQMRLF